MRAVLVALATFVAARDAIGQSVDSSAAQPAMPVFAVGQPPLWHPFASGLGVVGRGHPAITASFGVERPLLNPVTGLLAVSGEALGGWRSGVTAAGARLLARSPGLGFGFGADWTSTTHSLAPVLSFQQPLRRGGIVGLGSTVRLDWLFGPQHSINVGIQLPVAQPLAGRTRPRRITAIVRGPERRTTAGQAPADSANEAMAVVDATAKLLSAFVNPYPAADESTLVAAFHNSYGRRFDATARTYVG